MDTTKQPKKTSSGADPSCFRPNNNTNDENESISEDQKIMQILEAEILNTTNRY